MNFKKRTCQKYKNAFILNYIRKHNRVVPRMAETVKDKLY